MQRNSIKVHGSEDSLETVGTSELQVRSNVYPKHRAKAVMNELTTKYSINAEQLKTYSVASLSLVTSNSTVEGKAGNRRIEIVEQ